MRGRVATPAEVKRARGTLRKSREKAAPELPVSGYQAPPAHLSKEEKALWKVFCTLAAEMRVLTEADLHTLERLCGCAAEVRHLHAAIAVQGHTYQTETGLIKANPAVAMLADADRRLLAYLTHFGMTPAARSKVAVLGKDGHANPEEEFFN